MKILVVSSCTGKKASSTPYQLTLKDFKRGASFVERRERRLWGMRLRAVDMYEGRQHTLLVKGLEEVESTDGNKIDFRIVSAGYGFITAEQMIAPYDVTFSTMSKEEMLVWGAQLRLTAKLRGRLRQKNYDLAIVALGDPYLTAASFDEIFKTSGPVIVFCSRAWWKKLFAKPAHKHRRKRMKIIPLANEEAKRFREGLTSLKGELASRIVRHLARQPRPDLWVEDFMKMSSLRETYNELERLGTWEPEAKTPDEEE